MPGQGRISAALFAVFLMIAISAVQASADEYTSMSLEELMDVKLSIASKKALTSRESPGIVTVITREEILNTGARDLLEVLTLLAPGIGFGVDVEGVVGIGMRGIWGHEGKILLMIDGQEVNEEQFATSQFGNHYPVETIEKIEIIRGPGSAIYGGYASLGVINIISRANDLKGGFVSGHYAQTSKDFANRTVAFGLGDRRDDLSFSLTGLMSQGARSDRHNVDVMGNAVSMKGDSELNPTQLNFNLKYGELDVRAIMDQYRTTQRDLWGENYQAGALDEDFDSYLFGLKYSFKEVGGEKLTLIPEWKLKIQKPWNVSIPDQTYTNDKEAQKMQLGLTGIWDITSNNNIVMGVEGYNSTLSMPDNPGPFEETFKNRDSDLEYNNLAGYLQWMNTNEYFNTTLGGRYDYFDEYGSSFTPRAGVTKAWDKLHAKLMYSKSFRIPGGIIPNRIPDGHDGVSPEEAQNYEIEVGYRLSERSAFTVNSFYTDYKDVIVYSPDPITGVGSYRNSGELGSHGFEAEYRYKGKSFDARLNYAYYHSSDESVPSYLALEDNAHFLAFPQQRLNLLFDFRILEGFSAHPSLSFYGDRYGYAWDSDTAAVQLQDFDTEVVGNLNFRFTRLGLKGLSLNAGVRNLFDNNLEFIQPYDGGHAPLPSQRRAYYALLEYAF